ncbi:MAG: GntR family transcriptional regulator [Deltaproteobacteria bacterium]|jgi:GntR family transcriptional regulator|nr:GntR family transcriptional regulator [Deltaproteobacteria bacterium]
MEEASFPGDLKSPSGRRRIPPYQRMADLIRSRIMEGVYKAGGRIPSENSLSKSSGLSPLTVRKALRILVDEGLLERFTGKGTYVTELSYRKALFSLTGLDERLRSKDLRTRIVRAEVRRASPETAERLGRNPGDPCWFMRRCVKLGRERPFLVQESFVILDPYRPVVESELAAGYLTGLFSGGAQGLAKTAKMRLRPVNLASEHAVLLNVREGSAAFRMEYVFYDAQGAPLATGAFISPEDGFTLTSTIGFPLNGENGR